MNKEKPLEVYQQLQIRDGELLNIIYGFDDTKKGYSDLKILAEEIMKNSKATKYVNMDKFVIFVPREHFPSNVNDVFLKKGLNENQLEILARNLSKIKK